MWAGEQINMCIFISNMKFLSLILLLEGLCTDAGNDTDADDDDNYAQWTNHDYTGLFGFFQMSQKWLLFKIFRSE